EIHPVSKSSVHRWIKKFEEKLPISAEKKQRNLIAIDETVVKAKKKYCGLVWNTNIRPFGEAWLNQFPR
ncbi:MAG: hypothetical protein ABWW66_03425, partial [Archaeoglobaceae archaeon]